MLEKALNDPVYAIEVKLSVLRAEDRFRPNLQRDYGALIDQMEPGEVKRRLKENHEDRS